MENLFLNLTVVTEGISSMFSMYVDWLMNDGLFFGLLVIVLPLTRKIINILLKFRR